jgi:hypothetical protein
LLEKPGEALVSARVIVAFSCVLGLSACGSKAGGGGGGGAGGAGGADAGVRPDGATATCTSCRSDQVCVGGACLDVPSMCPCPKETYCNLGAGRCVIGCTADDQCDTGRICMDASRQCRAGCRDDSTCAAGLICVNTVCTPGCRADSACAIEQLCDTTALTCHPGCHDDSGCKTGHICDQMLCRAGCRADSACPAGQICDATSLTCQAGCRADSGCAAGQICDVASLTCRTGCRADSACPAGQLCDATSLTCRAGCHVTSDCPLEQICNTSSLTCAAGCGTDDARCNAGHICQGGQCVDGCRTDATCPTGQRCFSNICRTYCTTDGDCPLGKVCNTSTQQCVDGCGLPGKVKTGNEYLRCPLGQACYAASCNASGACQSYTCSNFCFDYDANNQLIMLACHSSAAHPFTCWGAPGNYSCSESCTLNDRTHPCNGANEVCGLAWNEDPTMQPVSICLPGCRSDVDCYQMLLDMSFDGANCICQLSDLPDAPAGTCRYPSATAGAQVCWTDVFPMAFSDLRLAGSGF